ncbi:MAG: hypothetical protein ACE5D0_07525 [Fidelibacterota bacterium]
MISHYGCRSVNPRPAVLQKENEKDYRQMVIDQKMCRGKGTLISKGSVNGKLSFYFTSTGEDVYIHFKDLLGRLTMVMILKPNSVEAWDTIQNIRFSQESIYIRFPFFEYITPKSLISIFWGYEPKFQFLNNMENKSAFQITFSRSDLTIDAVQIVMKTDAQIIDILFEEREYGSAYPQLIKPIPSSIPQAQS